ncbi:MAG: septum formation initiator family protein [Bacteroidales bacterium]|nr:septum formation initiator family protein [Bacteroidales bacterium]
MEKNQNRQPFWKSGRGSFVTFAIVATAVFLVYICFISSGSVLRWIRANMEIRRQEKLIETYQADIERMGTEVELLSSDKDSLEKFAREKFHFAAPGEDVYIEE